MPDSNDSKISGYTTFSVDMIDKLCGARSLLIGVEKIVEQEDDTDELSSAKRLLGMLKEKIDSVISAIDEGPEEYLTHGGAEAKGAPC